MVLNTFTGILKAYATVASMETFTASQSDRHPADLAMLRGARLVTSQETEGRSPLGRVPHQGHDWRRSYYSPLHAHGLLHLPAGVQVAHRWEPPPRPYAAWMKQSAAA